MASTTHPFAVEEPGNVPLPRAPLVRTIAQVRFPHLTQFRTNEDAVSSAIAAAMAKSYPLMDVGQEVAVTITSEGVSENRGDRLWRLSSADRAWQVSFSGNFLSIDTTNYARRSDFAQRLTDAWVALNEQVEVPYIERLGVRYINQVVDPALLERLPELLRPEVLGLAQAKDVQEAFLASALSEARYVFPEGGAFQARWGLLPRGTAVDSARSPENHETWLLDMDSFHEFVPSSQSGANMYEDVRELALRCYRFFRWAVTDEFLTSFGGER